MTVCGPKAVEANTMNTPNRNSVVNRPSFMITDILSGASSDKLAMPPLATNYLEHLKRFSAIEHEYRMQMPAAHHLDGQRKEFSDSDDDDFDDGEARSSDGSNHGKEDDDLNDSNRSRTSAERLAHKKQRKARTAFTDHQLHSMEKCFSRQKYLSVQDRMELANKLGISDTQVKTWFQNRRTKWKRQTAVGLELFVEAGNYAAYQRAYAQRYGQLDGLPYPSNPLMLAGAAHPILPPSNVQSPALDSYYQALQSGLGAMQSPYGTMFGGAHRPMPFHAMPNQSGFLPPNAFYPLPPVSGAAAAAAAAATTTVASPEHRDRSHSLSPTASHASSHSPVTSSPATHSHAHQPSPAPAPPADDNESDIEV